MKRDERDALEPARLLDRAGESASSDLARALRALRNERPSPMLVERVAERLVQASELPLTASSSVAPAAQTALASKWLLSMLAVTVAGTVATWVWTRDDTPQRRRDPSAATQSAARTMASPEERGTPAPASETAAAPSAKPGSYAEPAPSAKPAAAPGASRATAPAVRRGEHDRDRRAQRAARRALEARHAAVGSTASGTSSVERAAADARTSAATSDSTVSPDAASTPSSATATRARPSEPEVAQPARRADEEDRAARTEPLPTEAQLLVRARALATADPEQAFALLSQHERRFPRGLLAPEREVLAIEVLRLLGRSDEAARRLAAFRALFPDSPHVRRLTRP